MDRIITARDYMELDGDKSYRGRIARLFKNIKRRYDTPPKLEKPAKGKAIKAEIDWGRWIARCPNPMCNGVEDVTPEDPVFYCFSCGNYQNNGHLLPVAFPSNEERGKIEKELLKRPVVMGAAPNEMERIIGARPAKAVNGLPHSRNWRPGETVEDLKRENKEAGV